MSTRWEWWEVVTSTLVDRWTSDTRRFSGHLETLKKMLCSCLVESEFLCESKVRIVGLMFSSFSWYHSDGRLSIQIQSSLIESTFYPFLCRWFPQNNPWKSAFKAVGMCLLSLRDHPNEIGRTVWSCRYDRCAFPERIKFHFFFVCLRPGCLGLVGYEKYIHRFCFFPYIFLIRLMVQKSQTTTWDVS